MSLDKNTKAKIRRLRVKLDSLHKKMNRNHDLGVWADLEVEARKIREQIKHLEGV